MSSIDDTKWVDAGAQFSPDYTHRYALWRVWDVALPATVWIMLNPSTANGSKSDATIRKCIGFAKRWGCGAIYVANLFSLVSKDPKVLKLLKSTDHLSKFKENLEAIESVCQWADVVQHLGDIKPPGIAIAAWSSHGEKFNLASNVNVRARLRAMGVGLHVLGLNKDRSPKHPLYVPYDMPLVSWDFIDQMSGIFPKRPLLRVRRQGY